MDGKKCGSVEGEGGRGRGEGEGGGEMCSKPFPELFPCTGSQILFG
jgi:hypothetical protein